MKASRSSAGSVCLGRFLRRLRTSRPLSLRQVQHRTASLGLSVDNSQLARFEAGKELPSLQKLRVLSQTYGVSLQVLSETMDIDDALGEATEEIASSPSTSVEGIDARMQFAYALSLHGLNGLADFELKQALSLTPASLAGSRITALVLLSIVRTRTADYWSAMALAQQAHTMAREAQDPLGRVFALNALGRAGMSIGELERAETAFREALEVLPTGHWGAPILLNNLGGLFTDRAEPASRRFLKAAIAHPAARPRHLACAHTNFGDYDAARGAWSRAAEHYARSDEIACSAEVDPRKPSDILFVNEFRRWQHYRDEGRSHLERMSFGRLRELRSEQWRRTPEVAAFDRHVGATRGP